MEENIYDTAFLLGVNYVSQRISNTQILPEVLSETRSKFSVQIPAMLKNLKKIMTISEISKKFLVSEFFLEIIFIRARSGFCKFCDNYFENIPRHLLRIHNLDSELIKEYYDLFPETHFALPSRFKEDQLGSHRLKTDQDSIKLNNFHVLVPDFEKKQIFFTPFARNPEKSLCSECGIIINNTKKSKHIWNHRVKFDIQCKLCLTKMKRKNYLKHERICKNYYLK